MATQRHYRAPCPGCGAPVEFHSAQSTHAVCAYCQSTVVRSGEVLSRLGKMAEVFDDHSPLQLQASGRITLDGQPQRFTLVGRLQWHAEAGRWTEWYALLDDGSTATLSEDNGAYVFTRPLAAQRNLPDAPRFVVGSTTAINGKRYSVAANLQAQLLAAQGELPKLPALGQPCTLVELRSEDGEVLAIDYSSQPPHLEHGRAVRLEALEMSGLRDAADKDERARQFDCPQCGAPVQVQLDTTQSCTCPSCASLIDLRQGIGGELRAALQDEPVRPSIALGKVGRFEGVDWQVVGFQHRMGQEAGDDEQFGWDEYLLFNRQRGFIFLSMPPMAGAWCAPPRARPNTKMVPSRPAIWAKTTSCSRATVLKPPTCWASFTGPCSAANALTTLTSLARKAGACCRARPLARRSPGRVAKKSIARKLPLRSACKSRPNNCSATMWGRLSRPRV